MDLINGQNAALPAGARAVDLCVEVDPGTVLDVSALQLDAGGRVLSDECFVFFNQPSSPDGSVRLLLDGARSRIRVVLADVDRACERIIVVVSPDAAAQLPRPLGQATGLLVHVQDADGDGVPPLTFRPRGLTTETALVLGEVYRRAGAWKFRAVGQGYDNGLAGVARDHGVDVEDDAGGSAGDVSPGAGPAVGSPPSAADAAAQPPSAAPSPPATAPDSRLATLWEAAGVWNRTQDVNEEILTAHLDAICSAVRAMSAAEPSLSGVFAQADAAAEALRSTFAATYGSTLTQGPGQVSEPSLQRWTDRVGALTREIASARVPLLRAGRDKQMSAFSGRASELLRGQSSAEMATLVEHHRSCSTAAVTAFRQEVLRREPDLVRLVEALPGLPPVVGSLAPADVLRRPPTPGAGPLLVQVGSIIPGPLDVAGRSPHDSSWDDAVADDQRWEPPVSWRIPALLDMSMVNGVVTTSVPTVNNILLKLVSLLPAGQFTMTLFDPVKLGDNAKFIFGLGDAASSIIGDKVRSTDRELAEVLVGLEEHLGFVTQKYLQGQYETLADYNEAAGEVAEPYRALVLYDFPNGFMRPGGAPDEEMLARLRKIIGSGRRCGVMTLVTRSSPDYAPDSPASQLYPLFPTVELSHWLARHLSSGVAGTVEPTEVSVAVPGWVQAPLRQSARQAGATLYRSQVKGCYRFEPEPTAAQEVVAELLAGVERGLTRAADVRVSLEQVSRLAIQKQDRDVAKGTRSAEVLPVPSDVSTWWHGSAGEAVAGAFGRVGASDLGTIELDSRIASGALIGGRMGSGKSVLLHAMILSLAMRYSPDELSLYLVDFKEGVEFKAYAAELLPHAKVVAVESEREFGLSVLQSLDAEITRRGALFRASDGQELNLSQYRARSREPLPRIVLLVDEFHVLFNQDDKIAASSADLLDRVVRQGRAFGVHVILASQTLSGASALNKTTLGLVPIRIALQSSEADSRVLLADDNPDARLLTRPGEGLLNTKGGLRDANSRFQAAFTAPDERAALLRALRELADRRGMTQRPVVFEGREAADVSELPAASLGAPYTRSRLDVPIGLPLTLDPPVSASLRREPGGNLLVVLSDDSAYGSLTVAMASLLRSGARVRLLDYGSLDAPWDQQLSELAGSGLEVARRHTARAVLDETRKLVEERHALNDMSSPPVVLVLAALHRAREFDTSSADGPEPDDLAVLLREGPYVGVHVVAWCDKPISLSRRLTSSMLREFSLRLIGPMGKDDSFGLIDSDAAATLKAAQVVLDDHDRGVTTRARRFQLPSRLSRQND